MRVATVIRIVVVLVVALAVTGVAILMSTDFGRYKSEIESAVRDATGRQLVIDGGFSLHLGLTPAIRVENVRLANAPWGSRPDMALIGRIAAEIKLLPLVFGEVRIKRLVISNADILLETDKQGAGNWMFATGSAEAKPQPVPSTPPAATPRPAPSAANGETPPPTLPSFDRVGIENARLVWHDGRTGRRDEIAIKSLDAQADSADAPLRIALHALYTGSPVALVGTFGPLSALARPAVPWPFEFSADAGGATFQAKGTIRQPLQAEGIDVTLVARADDLSRLGALAGRAVPPVGPFRFDARVVEKDAVWTAHNLALALGKSSLAGELSVDTHASPPKLRATLAAPLLDSADFAGGKAADKPVPPAASPGAPPAHDGRVFDDTRLPVEALRTLDADIAVRANRAVIAGVAFDDARATLRIAGGVLTADPVKATVAGAPVTAMVGFGQAAGTRSPSLALKLDAARLDLAAILKQAGEPVMATGKVDISVDVRGSGASVRALMASLSGNAELAMGKGSVADDTLDLLSADVLKAITPWAPRRHDLAVRCVVGRYDIRKGAVTSRATLFDSDRVALTGEGGLNLGNEQIAFTVVPHARDVSLLQLAMPIRIGGTLAAPVAYPDAARMATGAVGTVAGLPVTVAGALTSLLGGSSGDAENPCRAALDKSGKAPPPGPAKGIGRTIEGIGQGIGKGIDSGIRSLFGQ